LIERDKTDVIRAFSKYLLKLPGTQDEVLDQPSVSQKKVKLCQDLTFILPTRKTVLAGHNEKIANVI